MAHIDSESEVASYISVGLQAYMFPIEPAMTPELAHFRKHWWDVPKYFHPLISNLDKSLNSWTSLKVRFYKTICV